jgi:signal transduction histidine kinase
MFLSMQEGVYLHELVYDKHGKAINYRVIDANPISEKYLNIKREDALGKLATDLFGTNEAPFLNIYAEIAETGKPYAFEQYFEPMGKHFFISVFSPKKGEFATAFLDITTTKEYEKELVKAKEKAEESEQKISQQKNEIELNNERLESLLKISQFQTNSIQELLDFALSEAINLTKSKIGYIYFYNQKTRQFTLNTWSKEVMKECEVVDPQTIYDLDATGCWGEAVRQRKPIVLNDYQAENPHKKGTPHGHVKLLKFLTIPVIFDDKIVAVAGVANKAKDYDKSDIRQLTLLMDNVWKISERISLIENLKIAKEKAEESDRLKTAFLQNMSHEIRTPLNGINGFSKMLDKPALSKEKRKKFTSIIINSSNQLISIVNDILTISSLETKQEKINLTKVSVNNIIADLTSIFKQQSINKNISLYAKQPLRDKQSEIYTDKTKITQVLSNSLKFTQEGFIKFGYNLKADVEPAELEFFVKDSGIGINTEIQDSIFERFRQANETTSKKYGGTGLGLAISKAFVELLGGKIRVQSEPDKGSTFYFTIPYKPVNDTDKPET